MFSLLRAVFSPILSLVLFALSGTFFTSFVTLRLKYLDFSDSEIGLVHSSFYAGFLVGSAYIERLILRVGHIRSFSTFASITIASVMIQAESTSEIVWIVTRFFAGVSMSALYCVVESWLLSKSTTSSRGRILAIYMFALYMSQSFSQIFLAYIHVEDMTAFFYAGLLASFSILPLSITKSASPEVSSSSTRSLSQLLEISLFGVSGCFLAGFMLSAVYSFTPLFAQGYGIKVAHIMALTIAGGFIFQWPLGKISDIFDRRKVLLAVCAVATVPCLLLFFFHGETFVLVTSFILGGLLFTIYPLSINQVCDRLAEREIHGAVGQLSLVYGMGAIVGPLIVPFFITYLSYSALFLYHFCVVIVLFLIGVYAMKRRIAVPGDLQGNYVSMHPRTTPVAAELIPTQWPDIPEKAPSVPEDVQAPQSEETKPPESDETSP